MPLTNEGRVQLLNRAIQLESRSFLEYMAHSATPVDIAKFPAVKQGFEEIAHEEDVVVQDLADAILDLGAHPEALGCYDLNFTSYNYITTKYGLEVVSKAMQKNLAGFEAILAEAKGDEVEPRLRDLRERKARQLKRIDELREQMKDPAAAAKAAAAAPAAPPAPAAHGP